MVYRYHVEDVATEELISSMLPAVPQVMANVQSATHDK